MPQVNPVSVPAVPGASSPPRAAGPGKNEFLQLLVTQLRHQDPLKPLEDKEFIAQLAQFNTLEQMQQMNKSIEAFTATQDVMAAAGLLGKTVEYKVDQATLMGIVSRVSWATGTPKLTIGDKEVDLLQIQSVR